MNLCKKIKYACFLLIVKKYILDLKKINKINAHLFAIKNAIIVKLGIDFYIIRADKKL